MVLLTLNGLFCFVNQCVSISFLTAGAVIPLEEGGVRHCHAQPSPDTWRAPARRELGWAVPDAGPSPRRTSQGCVWAAGLGASTATPRASRAPPDRIHSQQRKLRRDRTLPPFLWPPANPLASPDLHVRLQLLFLSWRSPGLIPLACDHLQELPASNSSARRGCEILPRRPLGNLDLWRGGLGTLPARSQGVKLLFQGLTWEAHSRGSAGFLWKRQGWLLPCTCNLLS